VQPELGPLARAEERPEPIEIHAADGHVLRGDVREPKGKPVGVAVLAHAMFARRSEFERPAGRGLARFLAERGWRTVAFDFRGHGDSGPGAASGGSWSYDDLVLDDLPSVVACARARARRLPVVVVGHSLGGHVALAGQGIGRLGADAIVAVASNVWLPSLEPSRARWLLKRAVFTTILAMTDRRGFFPARALRLGSDDEARAYFAAFRRFATTDTWASDDGRHDYLASLRDVRVPVFSLTSEGDRLNCHPDCAERFVLRCSGPVELDRVRRSDDGGPPPGHMDLVTSDRVTSARRRMEAWMRAAAR
jgi:predicted alpha/beta hydrolase